MINEDSIFEAEPDDLRRLVRSGMEINDTSAEGDKSATASIDGLLERPGARIGRYKLLSVLGEGGMGIVYLAEQEKPVRRRVALKVIKPGMDSARVMARFEVEQQALALMEHPHVARVYDAGLTASGHPYFVMEYVKGTPITTHCDQQELTIEERLRLFLHLCEAVQHAHQKGIIHRDLKPSNILVTVEDEEAVPKVIDFGVARAVSQPFTQHTLYTEQGQLLGTPEYMSPEQVDRNNVGIDIRTDIYSLGVVLYELLAGVLPFDPQTFQAGGIEHIRRVICEDEPKTPSTKLSRTSAEESAESARRRQTDAKALQRRLQGDLDWITLKAMAKDRSRRYASAGELASDINCHLSHEPVAASPPSTVYWFSKFVRRHKALVGGGIVVLAVSLIGTVVSLIFAFGQARARAEAQAVSDFLLDSVFWSLNPWVMRGEEITARSVLNAASEKLDEELADQPLVRASIRQRLASAYGFLGLYEPAELHATRALETLRRQLGAEDQATLYSMYLLGWVYWWQNRYDEAEPLLTQAKEGMEVVLSEEHPRRLSCMATLAWVYSMQGRLSEAQQLFEGGLATARQRLGEQNRFSPTFLNGLAFTHWMQGQYEDAEGLYIRGLRISRSMRGEKDLETLMLVLGLGELRWVQGRYDEAEQLLKQALDGMRRALGEHPNVLLAMSSLGWLYLSQARYEEAESLLVKALETARRVLGEAHLSTGHATHGLGTLYLIQGRYDEAEPLLGRALEIWRELMGQENWLTLRLMSTLACLYTARGRYGEAESVFEEVLKGRRRELGEDHPDTLETINDFGVLRREQKKHVEAESLLRQALDDRQRKLGENHPACFESMHELAVLYIRQARYENAEPLLLDAFHGREAKLGPDHPHTIESLRELVRLYESRNKPDEAAQWRTRREAAEPK